MEDERAGMPNWARWASNIVLAFGIVLLPIVFAWLTLRRGYSWRWRAPAFAWALAMAWFMFTTEPSSTAASTSATAAEPAAQLALTAPREAATTPPAARPRGAPFNVFSEQDANGAIKAQRSRTVVMARKFTRSELRAALIGYYRELREELTTSTAPVRHVYIFAYPTVARARAGLGEWQGHIAQRAFDGQPLPETPDEVEVRMPKPGTEPTPEEDSIYDEWMAALKSEDSAEKYQQRLLAKGRGLTSQDLVKVNALRGQDEATVQKRMARKYHLPEKELQALWLKVANSRAANP